jgi:hypothetical protein
MTILHIKVEAMLTRCYLNISDTFDRDEETISDSDISHWDSLLDHIQNRTYVWCKSCSMSYLRTAIAKVG